MSRWYLVTIEISCSDLLNHQDCHNRAWEAVRTFVETNLSMFVSKTSDAEAVVTPNVRAWIREKIREHGNAVDDHSVVMILNCPTVGILTAGKESSFLNFITNVISDLPLNSMCLLVHPNRAGQAEGRTQVPKMTGWEFHLASFTTSHLYIRATNHLIFSFVPQYWYYILYEFHIVYY